MADGFSVKITGMNDVMKKITAIADIRKTDSLLNSGMKRAAKPALEFAKERVPVGNYAGGGTLRRSLTQNSMKNKKGNRNIRVGPESDYVEQDLSGSIDASGTGSLSIGGKEKRPSKYAHLVEYGFTTKNGGRVEGRSFMRAAENKYGGEVYTKAVAAYLWKSYRRLVKKAGKK